MLFARPRKGSWSGLGAAVDFLLGVERRQGGDGTAAAALAFVVVGGFFLRLRRWAWRLGGQVVPSRVLKLTGQVDWTGLDWGGVVGWGRVGRFAAVRWCVLW